MSVLAAIFAFLHHLGAFALVGAVFAEFLLIRNELNPATVRRLVAADLTIGIAAAVVLTAGSLRVLFFEKGSEYYLHNIAFLCKMALFVAVGVLSTIPTRQFLSWRNAARSGIDTDPIVAPELQRRVRNIIHWELAGVVLILLCAALMAKGIG
jgi:putative membrane protein